MDGLAVAEGDPEGLGEGLADGVGLWVLAVGDTVGVVSMGDGEGVPLGVFTGV